MIELKSLTPHIVVDTSLQYFNRSSVVGGIFLENYSIAIDSGVSYETGKLFRQDLESYFNVPVRYLFLTHTHTDHRGGIEAFKDVTIIASQNCIKNMPKSIKLSNYNIEAFENKLSISENKLGVEFYLVKGHSVGSSVAYFPYEKILFGGDLFFTGDVNFNLPFLSFYQNKSFDNTSKKTGNPDEYIDAFENFLSIELEIIVPGHGKEVLNPKELLNSQLSFFKSLKSFFITVINEEKALAEISLPNLELIEQAKTRIENEPQNKKYKDKVWLNNYLDKLKMSFYNHYKNETKE